MNWLKEYLLQRFVINILKISKFYSIMQTSLKLKQLRMMRKLKYNQRRSELNQLNELEQLIKLLAYHANELS